jgi:ketosteroid isomerase-like protein
MKPLKLAQSVMACCFLACGSAAALPAMAQEHSYADDRALIENMSNRYMVAVDAGDIDTVLNTWADDGVLVWLRGTETGKAAIEAAMSRFGGAGIMGQIPADATERRRTRHQIVNHIINVDGDSANSTAYWYAMTNDNPHGEIQLLYMGHYEDELARIDGEWKFKRRTVYNESFQNKALYYPGLGESDPRASQ